MRKDSLRLGANEAYEQGVRDGLLRGREIGMEKHFKSGYARGFSDGSATSPSLSRSIFASKAKEKYNELAPDPDVEMLVDELLARSSSVKH